jgi:hypothetical protein
MFVLKACTRCRGDLSITADGETSCIQCGHELPVSDRMRLFDRIRHTHPEQRLPILEPTLVGALSYR